MEKPICIGGTGPFYIPMYGGEFGIVEGYGGISGEWD